MRGVKWTIGDALVIFPNVATISMDVRGRSAGNLCPATSVPPGSRLLASPSSVDCISPFVDCLSP